MERSAHPTPRSDQPLAIWNLAVAQAFRGSTRQGGATDPGMGAAGPARWQPGLGSLAGEPVAAAGRADSD